MTEKYLRYAYFDRDITVSLTSTVSPLSPTPWLTISVVYFRRRKRAHAIRTSLLLLLGALSVEVSSTKIINRMV